MHIRHNAATRLPDRKALAKLRKSPQVKKLREYWRTDMSVIDFEDLQLLGGYKQVNE